MPKRIKKNSMSEKEIDELLDEIRFYMAYGIFRSPVTVKSSRGD